MNDSTQLTFCFGDISFTTTSVLGLRLSWRQLRIQSHKPMYYSANCMLCVYAVRYYVQNVKILTVQV